LAIENLTKNMILALSKKLNIAFGYIRVNGGGAAGYQHMYPLSGSCQFQCKFQLIVTLKMKRNWFETRDKDNSPHSSGKGHIRWHKKKVCICKPVFNGGSLILVDNQQFQVFEKKNQNQRTTSFRYEKSSEWKELLIS
jgi:hypothetical protein